MTLGAPKQECDRCGNLRPELKRISPPFTDDPEMVCEDCLDDGDTVFE